jgi:Galactose oxidase, central domain
MPSGFAVATHSVFLRWLAVAASACALTACGGSSGSNNSGSNPPASTHSLGGTVSGLTSDGLVLANGGTTVTLNSGATTFAFATQVTTGSTYAVSVQTTPAGLTCSVANGTGTMGSANIANVVVTCSPQSYTLGGTISGLTASGLVLTDGTDNLTVAANAAVFTMPTALAYNSSFSVSVASQPIGVRCSVTGGTGTIPASNVNSVRVACAPMHWVWEGGASVSGDLGNYNSAAPPLLPRAREGHMTWTDSAGHFWMFGGVTTGGEFNDVWEFDSTAGVWGWVAGSASLNPAAVYPAAPGGSGPMYTPGGRHSGVVWADGSGNLWLFGGLGIDGTGTDAYLNDLWYFNMRSGVWTFVGGPTTGGDFTGVVPTSTGTFGNGWPSARNTPASWIDNGGRLWMFGGFYVDSSSNSQTLNDLWVYDPTQGKWALMARHPLNSGGTYGLPSTPGSFPGARFGTVTWKDSSGRLWLLGGVGADSHNTIGALADLWMLDPGNVQWTWMGGSNIAAATATYGSQGVPAIGNWPGARGGGVAWTDAAGNFWTFGGRGYDGTGGPNFLNDLWMYNPTTQQWTWVSGSNIANSNAGNYGTPGSSAATNQPGGRVLFGGWADSSGHLWMFGGLGVDSAATQGDLNDLWRF